MNEREGGEGEKGGVKGGVEKNFSSLNRSVPRQGVLQEETQRKGEREIEQRA
jgi:hypothetical protein